MEVPRLGVESDLWPLAYVTATRDLSHVYNQHHSSEQRRILNPLMEARDWTHILMDISQVTAVPQWELLKIFSLKKKKKERERERAKKPTSIHKDVGSIPGLTQWVKDLALVWAVV